MMGKNRRERSILTASVDSRSKDVFEAVSTAVEGRLMEEVLHRTILLNV